MTITNSRDFLKECLEVWPIFAVLQQTKSMQIKMARPVCPLWVDTVEKVVSDPPKRNNRIRTASYLNRNCVRGRDFESMLRIRGRKIVFQQYRSKVDISQCNRHVRF